MRVQRNNKALQFMLKILRNQAICRQSLVMRSIQDRLDSLLMPKRDQALGHLRLLRVRAVQASKFHSRREMSKYPPDRLKRQPVERMLELILQLQLILLHRHSSFNFSSLLAVQPSRMATQAAVLRSR